MSLTSFIKEPDVRKKFAETFPLPKINLDAEMKAPPITKHLMKHTIISRSLLRLFTTRKGCIHP